MKRSVVFVHVPRTAGTSISTAFRSAYPGAWHIATSRPELYRMAPTIDVGRPFYLGGHYTPGDVQAALEVDLSETVNFTVLRDPVEQAVSLYHFWIMHADTGAFDMRALGRGLDYWIDYMAERHPAAISNPQCRQLAGEPDSATAADELRHRFDFVADARQLKRLAAAVGDASGALPAPVKHSNGAPRLESPSPEAIRRLRRLNSADLALNLLLGPGDGFWGSGRRRR